MNELEVHLLRLEPGAGVSRDRGGGVVQQRGPRPGLDAAHGAINFPFLQLFTVFCPPDIFPQPLNTQMASDGCNVTIVVNIKAKRTNFIFTFT